MIVLLIVGTGVIVGVAIDVVLLLLLLLIIVVVIVIVVISRKRSVVELSDVHRESKSTPQSFCHRSIKC